MLDATGAVLGVLLAEQADAARMLPPGVAFALGAERVAARLAEAAITTTTATRSGALAPADLAAEATRMTVLVSCWN